MIDARQLPPGYSLMAAPVRTPRETWVQEGLRALGVGGPDAVRIEALAQALGVTKGGFYWHFEGRPALLDEMLEAWERISIDEVIERVERRGGDARTRLRHLFGIVASAGELVRIELATREWARRDKAVAKRLRRVDNRRMDYMRALFGGFCRDQDEVEIRCMLVMTLFVGQHFVAADHGRRTRAQLVAAAMKQLMA